jgi:hypothetical protein
MVADFESVGITYHAAWQSTVRELAREKSLAAPVLFRTDAVTVKACGDQTGLFGFAKDGWHVQYPVAGATQHMLYTCIETLVEGLPSKRRISHDLLTFNVSF